MLATLPVRAARKAPGTASETTNMAAIPAKITSRAGITSSAGTALVSHE
jgi:hypothetical protein